MNVFQLRSVNPDCFMDNHDHEYVLEPSDLFLSLEGAKAGAQGDLDRYVGEMIDAGDLDDGTKYVLEWVEARGEWQAECDEADVIYVIVKTEVSP